MITLALLGQSLMQEYTTQSDSPPVPVANTFLWNGSSWGTVTGNGAITLANLLNKTTGHTIRLIQAGVGGSALCPESEYPVGSGNYWLQGNPGGPYMNFLNQCWAANVVPDIVIWKQGPQDYYQTTYVSYLAGLGQLAANIRTACASPNLPMLVCQSGDYAGDSTHKSEIQQAQRDCVNSVPSCYAGPTETGLLRRDGTHLYPTEYGKDAQRLAGHLWWMLPSA